MSDIDPISAADIKERFVPKSQKVEEQIQQKREEMVKRSNTHRIKRTAMIALGTVGALTLFGTGVGIASYFAWGKDLINQIPRVVRYQRTCSLPKEAGIELPGIRSYRSEVRSFMGYEWTDKESVREETVIGPINSEMNIIGLSENDGVHLYIPAGEMAKRTLPIHDRYIVVKGKKAYTILYEDFCKSI